MVVVKYPSSTPILGFCFGSEEQYYKRIPMGSVIQYILNHLGLELKYNPGVTEFVNLSEKKSNGNSI